MDFSHDEIEKRDLIEEYLLGRLSEEEETTFEEHLLHCDSCRQKCIQTGQIIEAIKLSSANDKDAKISIPAKRQIGWLVTGLRIAAVFVVFAGIAILYIKTNRQSGTISVQTKPAAVDTSYSTGDETIRRNGSEKGSYETSIPAQTSSDRNEKSRFTVGEKNELIAGAYRPSPVFEQAIRNTLRGEAIKVIVPDDSAVFLNNLPVVFNWVEPESKQITLLVRKNSGKAVFKQVVKPPYTLNIENPGLYYWQLLVNGHVIHTGKFMVNQ